MTTTTETPSAGTVADTAGTATDKAKDVASTATDRATDVAGTAKEQAAGVVGEALSQTHDLLGQATEQINAQAGEQTQRLSRNIRQLAQHFGQMAGAGEQGTPAQSLVQTAAEHADRAAGYLDGKQPGELVSDLQRLGRRRPGAFLLGAAVAGMAVGRLAGAAKRATGNDGGAPARTGGSTGTNGTTGTTGVTPVPDTAIADPMPPIRNVAPGAPTVEPYPTAPATDAR